MKLPRKIKVLGRPWTVVVKEGLVLEGHPCMGLCDHSTKTIHILKGMNIEDTKETFIHEWVHAVWGELGIHEDCMQPWIEHMIVVAISKELCQQDELWANILLET